jgi:ceramide glucosyltransferase
MHLLQYSLEVLLALLAICGAGYYVLCLWSARTFLRESRRRNRQHVTPPVSILKPLKGIDPDMYQSFRSHCVQEYPEYEIIFGISDAEDPAAALVRQLITEFPEHTIRLVVCAELLGTNVKVSNLIQMLPHARYEHLLINDSDIRVDSDYLRRIMGEFAIPGVGMVTSLYRGVPGATLGSKLEAVGISTDFTAGVLAARQLEGVKFALGSTLAFTRTALAAIAGLEPLLDYLADDFELGHRMAAAGFEVVLSDVVVDTHLPDYSFAQFFDHQLRWARSVRDSRRWGYLGVLLTFGLPWSLLAWLVSGGAGWAWLLLALVAALRFAMALVMALAVLHDRLVLRWLWLIPVRDVLALIVWAAGYASHNVVWRGEVFSLQNGKLIRVAPISREFAPIHTDRN